MKKTILWVAVVIVILVIIILLGSSSKTENNNLPNSTSTESEVSLTEPTGNIDDALNSILSESEADISVPSDNDSSLTAPEDLSGLDQDIDTAKIDQ